MNKQREKKRGKPIIYWDEKHVKHREYMRKRNKRKREK